MRKRFQKIAPINTVIICIKRLRDTYACKHISAATTIRYISILFKLYSVCRV